MQRFNSNQQRKVSFNQINVTNDNEKPERNSSGEDSKNQPEISALHSLQINQEVRLQKLDSSITKCEKNLNIHTPHKTNLENQATDLANELARIKEETEKLRVANEKKVKVLNEMKNEAEKDLQTMRVWEERHRLSLEAKKKELEDDLVKLKKGQIAKYEDSESMFKSREIALLHDLKGLATQLDTTEKEKNSKETELKQLKTVHKDLESRYSEMMRKR